MTSDYDYYLRRRNGAKLGYLSFAAGCFVLWQLFGAAFFGGPTGVWAIVMAIVFAIGTVVYLIIAGTLYSASNNPTAPSDDTEDEGE